jgi:polar amino acid transport system substrate-binding protein
MFLLVACEGGSNGGQQTGEQTTSDTATPPESDCQLTMGWDPWEPYHYRTPTGETAGLDVELITAAAGAADCELSFRQADFVDLLQMLRDGEVDLLPGATPTEERETFARFSVPYRSESFRIWVRAAERERYAGWTLRDLLEDGRRVGLTEGFIYGDEAEALLAQPDFQGQIVSSRIGDLNLLRLIDYDIDAMIEDPFVATSIQRRLGLEDDVVALEQPLVSGTVHLMFSRESVEAETVDRFNAGLEAVIEDGTRSRILERYSVD